MKPALILTLLASFLWSCNHSTKQTNETVLPDSSKKTHSLDLSKYHATQDTVLITEEPNFTLKFSKTEFNSIVDSHPEFFRQIPDDPDYLHCYNNDVQFNSEQGKDSYFALYAYFLKQKDGNKHFTAERERLVNIYRNINLLFGSFQYGGTYFGHQHLRILGYAEYSTYLLSIVKDEQEKTYDITKQKRLYMQSLRQLINDEVSIDQNTWGSAKQERIKELNKIVNHLDSLIIDNFYLRRTQEFHYRHYENY